MECGEVRERRVVQRKWRASSCGVGVYGKVVMGVECSRIRGGYVCPVGVI